MLVRTCVWVVGIAIATAQDRRPLVGFVRDTAGKPVAGAHVVLSGETSPGSWSTPADIVRADTDAEGRFRAATLDCVEYSAWAWRDGDGAARSEILRGITAGPRRDLVLAHPLTTRLSITGIESFQSRGPLRALLLPRASAGFTCEVPLDADGNATLPGEMPFAAGWLLLRDGNGKNCAWLLFSVQGAATLPPPRLIPVTVVDAAGAPVAGAEIVREPRTWQPLPPLGATQMPIELPLAITDAAGRATVSWYPLVADREEPIEMLARKTGFAAGWAGEFVDGRRYSTHGADMPGEGLRFTLTPAAPIAIRVRAGDRPVPSVPLLALVRDEVRLDRVGLHLERDVVVRTDADGRATLAEVADTTSVLAVRLGAEALQSCGKEIAVRAFPPGQPYFVAPTIGADRTCDLDLATLRPLSLQVMDPDGAPAAGAVVVLLPHLEDPRYVGERDARFRLDPAGRANVLLQPGSWFLCVLRDEQWAFESFDAGAGRIEVKLAPIPRLRISVRDAEGRPVAGARLDYESYTTGGRHGVASYQRDLIWVQLAQQWFRKLTTDANGDYLLPMFPDTSVEFMVRAVAGDRRSDPWMLRWREDPVEVTVR